MVFKDKVGHGFFHSRSYYFGQNFIGGITETDWLEPRKV